MWLKFGPGPSGWSSRERVGAGMGFGVMGGHLHDAVTPGAGLWGLC